MAQIIITTPLGRERESSFDRAKTLHDEWEEEQNPYGFIDRKAKEKNNTRCFI